MVDMYKDIHEFSTKFELPQEEKPNLLSQKDMEFRIMFMIEELNEIIESCEKEDLEGVFDGIIDLVYVALGTGWLMNLPIKEGWKEVHRANMQKERVAKGIDERSKRKHNWDVVKPEGWEPPKLKELLDGE